MTDSDRDRSLPQQDPTDLPDYGLDDDGNAALHRLVLDVSAAVERGEYARPEALDALGDGVRALSSTDPEVVDITVRDAVIRELDPVFVKAGFERLDPYEF